MNTALLTLALATLSPAQPPARFADRERHPFAPSLPVLTEKEQEVIDRIIDRLIEADVGKLKGAAAAKAHADFKTLGPEAIPQLIEGLNRAAEMEASCPAVLLAKKLAVLLRSSQDEKLLDFARENIGAGVKARRHQVVLKDLKLGCALRKSELQRRALLAKTAGGKAVTTMTVAELAAAAGSERGPRLKQVLTELERRQGEQVVAALSGAAASYEKDIRQLARGLLARHLGRQGPAALKGRLKDDRPEVRTAAAQAVGEKGLALGAELIDLLSDSEQEVQQSARQALVRLSRGQDHGPESGASADAVASSVERWRQWWASRKGK
ncbi:MAG: hypothetical protein L0Z62_07805 [Gemmataceae bacterium]|nr:hypothetical protein [Gemmataceae bacterium]